MGSTFSTDLSWIVELLQEWGSEQTAGVARGGRGFVDSEIDSDTDEMRALKNAVERLRRYSHREYAAVSREFAARGGQVPVPGHEIALTQGLQRLAVWVDAEMGE